MIFVCKNNFMEKETATFFRILAMNRGAWQATVHRVTKSWTRMSD